MKLVAIGILWAVVGGCGSRGGVAADGGADATLTDTAPVGRQSFDVVAALAAVNGSAGAALPATNTFTLVLAASAQQAIVGALGHAATVSATTTDGHTFHLGPFSVGVSGSATACGGATSIDYRGLDITVSGGTLHGMATGDAEISCGDCFFNGPFTAEVTGTADVTAPFLVASGTTSPGPFSSMSFVSNEPLPTTAKARLDTPDGTHIDLQPLVSDAEPTLIWGFTTPNVVLPAAAGFAVAIDGLVDFAGHSGAASEPLRLAGFTPPPLVPADGFESATTAQVGGAAVIDASGPLAPISGAKSVYFGAAGAPAISGATFGAAMRVRLAVKPGDTKVRFSYRAVSSVEIGLRPIVNVGSVGHAPAPSTTLDASANGTEESWDNGKTTVTVSPIATVEIALPAEVTDEVVVSIEALIAACLEPAPLPSGVELDDLALE